MNDNGERKFISHEGEGELDWIEIGPSRQSNRHMGEEAYRAYKNEERETSSDARKKAKRVLFGVAKAAAVVAIFVGVAKFGDEGMIRTPENQEQWEETMENQLSDKTNARFEYDEDGSLISYTSPDGSYHYVMNDIDNDAYIESGYVTVDGGTTGNFKDQDGVPINTAEKRLNIAANSN